MASLPTFKVNVLRADLGVVDKRIRSGDTSKRVNVMDNQWGRWEQFCFEHNVDPYFQTWDDTVPIIQVFGERYHNGRLTPLHNAVKSRTA
jgi:protein gp37